jgi:hypothetical protein
VSELRKYDPVLVFSDGGRAIFSEYLMPSTLDWQSYFKLTPSPGASVVVNGRESKVPLVLKSEHTSTYTSGKYFYFGKAHLEKIGGNSFLFDTATPRWVADEVKSASRAILDFYGERLKTKIESQCHSLWQWKDLRTVVMGNAVTHFPVSLFA